MDIHWAKFWDALKNANLTPEQTQAISAALSWAGLDGKTLRDEFAMHAPEQPKEWWGGERSINAVIAWRYSYADRMLEARKK